MYCPCGQGKILAQGLCATCYSLKRQNEGYLGGLREAVLERDGCCCRVCGALGRDKRSITVHHRVPGKSLLHLMISLCLGCHAKVHRTKVVLTEPPPLLLELWREQHPEGHEQTILNLRWRNSVAAAVPSAFSSEDLDQKQGSTFLEIPQGRYGGFFFVHAIRCEINVGLCKSVQQLNHCLLHRSFEAAGCHC